MVFKFTLHPNLHQIVLKQDAAVFEQKPEKNKLFAFCSKAWSALKPNAVELFVGFILTQS